MNKSHYMLASIAALIMTINIPGAHAQDTYPIADKVAEKVISHYQTSSCEQLMAQKMKPPSAQREEMEQKALQQLRSDPKMRTHFLNRVAAPIANKMFECGMIP